MAPPIEPNKPGSSSFIHDFPTPESKPAKKKYHKKDVSPVRLKEPGLQADDGQQGTKAITSFETIKPFNASPLVDEKNSPVPEQELEELLSTDGELAKIHRENSENYYISESDRALKSLMESINNGDLNNDLSDKKAFNSYKNLVTQLNLPKDLTITLTMPSGDIFCLIPVNSRLKIIDNLQPLISTAIQLTEDIKDSRTSQQRALPPPSRKKEILENINHLLPRVNNPEPFISRLNEIKKPPICITTDSCKPSPADVHSRSTQLAITAINTPEQIEKLADQLTAHRKKVQSFIHWTQRSLLENGPDMRWIASHWPDIEGGPLQLARQLVGSGSEHLSARLIAMTGAIEDDIAGLKRYIRDAAKYDFRGGEQYLTQVGIYAEVVRRLSNTQSAKKKADGEIVAIIDSKRAIAQTSTGKTAQCVPDAIQELTGLHKQLKKRFNADLFEQELMKVLAEDSKSFSSRLHIYQHDRWHQVTLEYTPAASMRLHDDRADTADAESGNRDPFENGYRGKWALSMERNSPHAINMLAYTMKVDGQETARHIRVGCPYAYKEKGENVDRITDQRLDEIFTALLLHNHKQALQNAMKNPDHQAIQLDCLYLNLLSPDHIRDSRIARAAGLENEKEWTEKLHEKLMEMSNQERTLTIHYADGRSAAVKIRPRPVMLVAPCNKLALADRQKSLSGKILMANANTWKTVMEVNGAALQQLVGSNHQYGGLLGKKLPALSASKQHRAKELADELWALYNTPGGLRQVAEQSGPFYFSGKLRELSAIMGMDLFTGCKSNKDRTGLSEAVQQSMSTCGTSGLTEQFMVYGGHIMIQMKNTGLPGYKLDGTQAKQLDDSIFSKLTRH